MNKVSVVLNTDLGSFIGKHLGGAILDDLEEKQTFWGRRPGFCSLDRVVRTRWGGLPCN